jgi:hypothetical protein
LVCGDEIELGEDISKNAKSKVLDMAKTIGAIVTLTEYDFEFACESVQIPKIMKAFKQGSVR